MTEAEIITRVKERLDEDAATSQRYQTTDLTEYIYDGSRFYCVYVGNQFAQVQIVAEAYQQMYDLPCDFVQVKRVLWNNSGTYLPLEPIQTSELDEQFYQWQRMTDSRSKAYYRFSTRKIGLWPVPTEDGERYIVHYQQDVAEDLSAVAVEDHPAIVNYVLARCLLADGKTQEGVDRYRAYMDVLTAARARRSNADRVWGIGTSWRSR